MINPFKLYFELNMKDMLEELNNTDKEILIDTIKEYFSYSSKIKAKSQKDLAEYIFNLVENDINRGEVSNNF
jgi:hypothetical protein